MSRVGGEGRLKKRHGCVTCLIINIVVLVIFIAALFIGGSILFKTYVSPQIGGVTLGEALSLAGKVLFGKETKRDYTEDDLDSFYTELSSSLFLSDKTENELEYELLSEEAKATLASESVSAADAGEGSASYDNAAAYDRFCSLSSAQRYALLSDEMKTKVTSAAVYGALAADEQADLRKSLGLKTYRISVRSLMEGMSFEDGEFSTEGLADTLLSTLDFDFAMLSDYDINDPDAAANIRYNSITLTGKQVSAFINDVVSYLLTAPASPVTDALDGVIPADVDLTKYVYITSVTIMNTPLATSGGEGLFDQKDTALGVNINLKLRDLVKGLLSSGEIADRLAGVPSFALGIIPTLVPKNFSVGATVYPLADEADGREVKVTFNNSKEKHAVTLSKIVNGIMNGKGEASESTAEATFFGELNNEVAEVFKSINEQVNIQFVPQRDKEGNPLKDGKGNTYSQMRIMTVQTLLSLFDESGELSAHDIFTVMKCLYVTETEHAALSFDDDEIDALKTEVLSKYGLDTSAISFDGGFSEDTVNALLSALNLKDRDYTKPLGMTFAEYNEDMKVKLSAEALVSVLLKAFTGSSEGEESVSAADSGEASSMLKNLGLEVCSIAITEESEGIFALELLLKASLAKMIREQFASGEGIAATILPKVLPKGNSYFGMKVYISEYEEDGKVQHAVGSAISEESGDKTYAAKLRINDFNYEETSKVLDIFTDLLSKMDGGDFDLASITSTVESTLSELFSTLTTGSLALDLRLFAADDAAESNGGFLLPSIYDLFSGVINNSIPSLEEPFTAEDAQEVLSLVYAKDVDTTKAFDKDADTAAFLNEINEKYYLSHDARLSTDNNLFGGGDTGLGTTLGSSSIYFKPNATENAKWHAELGDDHYVKPALYTDTTAVKNLRVALTGSELAALVTASGSFLQGEGSDFGGVEILGASFVTEDGKTYLKFNLKCTLSKVADGESSGINLTALLPEAMKITAKILLYAPSYAAKEEEGDHRFDSTLLINDGKSGKIFALLEALGGTSLSESGISGTLSNALSGIFTALENNIPMYFSTKDGEAFTVTRNEKTENCIYLADVYTALIKTLEIKDEAGDTLTNAADLARRLRTYGAQLKDSDLANTLSISVFSDADKTYLSKNMQDAYFMKSEPNLAKIYTNASGEFSSFTSSGFRLNDLYTYSGTPRSLKISGKALGELIFGNATDRASFAGSVEDDSMGAALVGLRIEYVDATTMRFHAALKLSFGEGEMMPSYFYILSTTTETTTKTMTETGLVISRAYETKVTINGLEDTDKFFYNISSLMGDSVTFSLSTIEDTVNDSIEAALSNFHSSMTITYGAFDAADMTYFGTILSETDSRPSEGEGYLALPSVYSFLADVLLSGYTGEDKPNGEDLQAMLNAMYASEATLKDAILTNEKPNSKTETYRWEESRTLNALYDEFLGDKNFRVNEDNEIILASYSDTYLAHYLSEELSGESLDSGNISLENGIDQMIILRSVTGADAEDSLIQTQRAYWATKFNTTLEDTHDYLVVTIKPSFGSYSVTGSGENLLPSVLWFTILIDLNDDTNSKGLLYNMDGDTMNTFNIVLSSNGVTFDIDDIATQLASLINDVMDDINSVATKTYLSKEDDYTYCTSYPYAEPAPYNIKTDIGEKKCVGYIVFSLSTEKLIIEALSS